MPLPLFTAVRELPLLTSLFVGHADLLPGFRNGEKGLFQRQLGFCKGQSFNVLCISSSAVRPAHFLLQSPWSTGVARELLREEESSTESHAAALVLLYTFQASQRAACGGAGWFRAAASFLLPRITR